MDVLFWTKKIVKEIWDILETTHKETKTIKNSKLQMLTTGFEEIKMKDNESFNEFYAKLNNKVKSSFNLGEKILESKIVQKVLNPYLRGLDLRIISL